MSNDAPSLDWLLEYKRPRTLTAAYATLSRTEKETFRQVLAESSLKVESSSEEAIWREAELAGQQHVALLGLLANNCAVVLAADCLTHGRPFALYLRSFAIDASEGRSERLRMTFTSVDDDDSVFESSLAPVVTERMPIVGIGSPADPMSPFRTAPRIIVDDRAWADVADRLIAAARLVIVECVDLGPGLARELDVIVRHGRQTSTIVVLPCQRDRGDEALWGELRSLFGMPARPRRMTKDDPRLERFPHLVFADDVTSLLAKFRVKIEALLTDVPIAKLGSVGREVRLSTTLPWAEHSRRNGRAYVAGAFSERTKSAVHAAFVMLGAADDLSAKLSVIDECPELLTDQADQMFLLATAAQHSLGKIDLARAFAERLLLLRRARMVGMVNAARTG